MREPQWFFPHESLQRLNTESELTACERSLCADMPPSQTFKVGRQQIFGTIDNAEILGATAFDCRLRDAAPAGGDEVERLDHHALVALRGELGPPADRALAAFRVVEPDKAIGRLQEHAV